MNDMSVSPSIIKNFNFKCPHCERSLFPRNVSTSFEQTDGFFLYYPEIYCDPANQGCGKTASTDKWIVELPAILSNMINEVLQVSADELTARKNLETYFFYKNRQFYSEIPFETAAFKKGNTDCAIPFANFSNKQLIDIFNSQAGIDTLNKSECRIMFILLQELFHRGVDFNFFKSYDEEEGLHRILLSDQIELMNKKVVLTRLGRIKYL